MGRMMILAGLVVGLVGLAGDGQAPSSTAAAASEEPPALEERSTNSPCAMKLGPGGATATIVPYQSDDNKCGFRIHPKAVCIRSAGAIFWLVDMRTYPTSGCPTVAGFRLKDFLALSTGETSEPFEDNKCKELRKAEGPAGTLDKGFVTRCVLKRHDKDEDYEYEVVPIDEKGNELPEVDPEIRVRG
jgi:hypothetical protein